jgi:hypothetical protein
MATFKNGIKYGKSQNGYDVPLMPTKAEHDAWMADNVKQEMMRQNDRNAMQKGIDAARKRNPGKPLSSFLA